MYFTKSAFTEQCTGMFHPAKPNILSLANLHWFLAAHFQFQQSRSNHLVRKELQQHLYQHQQQLHGYIDYVQRNSHQLLTLVMDRPTQDPDIAETTISAREFDRLGLLLKPADSPKDDGSPMEISPSRFTGASTASGIALGLKGCDSMQNGPQAPSLCKCGQNNDCLAKD